MASLGPNELTPNLMKFHSPITSYVSTKLLCNFAQSTTVSLPCSVLYFKMFEQMDESDFVRFVLKMRSGQPRGISTKSDYHYPDPRDVCVVYFSSRCNPLQKYCWSYQHFSPPLRIWLNWASFLTFQPLAVTITITLFIIQNCVPLLKEFWINLSAFLWTNIIYYDFSFNYMCYHGFKQQ